MSDRAVWITGALGSADATTKAELLESVVDPERIVEFRQYVEDCFHRLLTTLELMPAGEGRVLELGANPYFFTMLLRRRRRYDLTLANFFGGAGEATQTITNASTGERHEFRYREFNVEEEPFPYPDAHFDGVVYAEIMEHLLHDPIHVFAEIHRVLRPEGWLVLTTPNAARRQNVLALARGRNFYDPYSGYGPYGRHNREYTAGELREMLTRTGFEVDRLFTRDLHPSSVLSRALALVLGRTSGYNLYVRAHRGPRFRWYYPPWLFRSGTPRHIQDPYVTVGVNDTVQIGRGWYDPERWPDGSVRWTTACAELFLNARGGERQLRLLAWGGPKELGELRSLSVTVVGAGGSAVTLPASLATETWTHTELKLPQALVAGQTLVRLEAAPFIPSDVMRTADRRPLGVAVREIGVTA